MAVSKRRLALGAIALSFFFLVMSGMAAAATITVDTLLDGSVAKHCTLRDAIIAADTKTATKKCVAGTGTDTIMFRVSGTITLGSTLPQVVNISPDSLTIDGRRRMGRGKAITVDGANSFQILSVNSVATLYLNNLTIAHGRSLHGGIENSGTLTVSNSTFSGNGSSTGSGGIENSGTLTVRNSTFAGNSGYEGGGIFNVGTLTVSNSTFSSNNAIVQSGGGIDNFNTAMVTNSTFSGNSSPIDFGGGIGNVFAASLTVTNSTFSGNSSQSGGGIGNGGTLTVTNSTFSNNIASNGGGGIINFGGPLTVTNSTFSNNSALVDGGGILNEGIATLKGTILAAESGGGNCGSFGPVADAGYNISDDNSCGFSGTSVNNSTTLHLDPLGLRNNGGPTETIALEAGSDAIDAIPFASCTDQATPPNQLFTDQRGFGRPDPEDGPEACDIGAYESGAVPVIYTGTVHGNLTITTGMTSIIDATVTGNLTQTGGSMMISDSTIEGNLQINGGGTFTVDDSPIEGNLHIQNLPPASAENQICGSEVNGDLQVHSNGAPITIGGMTSACPGNTIGKSLEVKNNTAAIEVFDDMIGGNLQCQKNTSITGGGNTAKSLQGQCASF